MAVLPDPLSRNTKQIRVTEGTTQALAQAFFLASCCIAMMHMGALIVDRVGLAEFANIYLEHTGPGFEFADVVKDMHQSPWLKIDARAACVSNPNASRQEVQEAIAWGCKHLRIFSCDDIDKSCQSDVFAKGDWVFSRYYRYTLHESSALEQCSFGGAAIFASPEVHRHFSSSCVLGGHRSQ
ncbi:unnamed protein product [Symbiodinium natans]|uniref:X8 domain-containing protein n=1 Tax=Symbiodinium natans TaxID=878477 RepID=A0A812QBE6_9DINO|nr:unnamed protein product [Symbiodinium natans]